MSKLSYIFNKIEKKLEIRVDSGSYIKHEEAGMPNLCIAVFDADGYFLASDLRSEFHLQLK